MRRSYSLFMWHRRDIHSLPAFSIAIIFYCFYNLGIRFSVKRTFSIECNHNIVENSVFSLGVLKYVVCLCRGYDGCCVFCLYCGAWSCRCSYMGSMSVSSWRCCVLCTSCGSSQCCVLHDLHLLILVEDAWGDHMEEAYSRVGLITAL